MHPKLVGLALLYEREEQLGVMAIFSICKMEPATHQFSKVGAPPPSLQFDLYYHDVLPCGSKMDTADSRISCVEPHRIRVTAWLLR